MSIVFQSQMGYGSDLQFLEYQLDLFNNLCHVSVISSNDKYMFMRVTAKSTSALINYY